MIKRVSSDNGLLSALGDLSEDKANVEALKIYALWLCYGIKYDFCRFYAADGAVICATDGSFVVSDYGKCDFEETAGFFMSVGYSEIFCSERVGDGLSGYMRCDRYDVELMRFNGVPSGAECVTEKDTPLEEFYGILKTSFDIGFEPWYLDMSHRVRHGVTRTRRLGGSVLVIQHDLFGSALISQVATVPTERGRGGASRLISSVCAELSGSEIYVICEDALCGFYEKNGFSRLCKKCILKPSAAGRGV